MRSSTASGSAGRAACGYSGGDRCRQYGSSGVTSSVTYSTGCPQAQADATGRSGAPTATIGTAPWGAPTSGPVWRQ